MAEVGRLWGLNLASGFFKPQAGLMDHISETVKLWGKMEEAFRKMCLRRIDGVDNKVSWGNLMVRELSKTAAPPQNYYSPLI